MATMSVKAGGALFTLSVLAAIFLQSEVVSGLTCYECHPDKANKKTCEHPGESTLKECVVPRKEEHPQAVALCSKFKVDGEVTRGCFIDLLAKKMVNCRTFGETQDCYCETDYCNGSSHKSISGFTLAISLLPTILMAKYLNH